jgi:DNA-binding winged helix-turn-helix (wHTH) protein/Tol biopolymer transport system component
MSEEIGRLGSSKKTRDPLFVPSEAADRNKQEIYEFGPFRIETTERKLSRGGEVIALTPKVFDMLVMLVRNSGHLLEKDELIRSLWPDSFVDESNLSTNIFMLRKALGNDHEYIETVPRRGYRFVGAVRQLPGVEKFPNEPRTSEDELPADRRLAGPVSVVVPLAARGPRYRLLAFAGTALAIAVVVVVWYLSWPPPLPRITAYTQITHDGRGKYLAGTDGNRLYFTQYSPIAILQIGVNGGETAPVPVPFPGVISELKDISLDASYALIATFEAGTETPPRIWVVPMLGGAARRLENDLSPSFSPASFSPDGASVIYCTKNGDIFRVRTDGTENHKLASVGSIADFLSLSPDGKSIRFTKDGLLWEMSADGSRLHRLLPDWKERGSQCCGQWTPDGRLYIFHLDSSPTRGELWALEEGRKLFRRGTTEPFRLTTGPVIWGRPVLSKDGKTIFAKGQTERGELSRIDTKTGGIQPYLGGLSAEFVSFSDDGKSVAYVSFPEGILWKADRDGSNRVELTHPGGKLGYPVNPRWSPDSRQILFTVQTLDGRLAIYLISADGGDAQKLLADDEVEKADANWSPDGKRILFDWGPINGTPEKRDLRIFDLVSRQVTTVPGSTGLWSTRWSPDGDYIAALTNPDTGMRIFDVKTQRWTALATRGAIVAFPSFSRDSRYIYFLRCANDQGVFRIPVTGGNEERVVDGNQWHTTGYDGCSMSLDPTGAPLILRDVGSNDIYALTLER